MKPDPQIAAGRAFVRSLNILLKFARLYGFEHVRTAEQLDTAWRELRMAIPTGSQDGLLLGASGSQLLLDGVPLEGAPAEKQFAQLLSAAGLASVQFFPSLTTEELSRFARAFPTGKAKPAELAQQLKQALAGAEGIRVNEVCFVATDSRLKETGLAAQLAAATLGQDQDKFKEWLNDPQKLLELIAAAQGTRSEGHGAGGAKGAAENASVASAGDRGILGGVPGASGAWGAGFHDGKGQYAAPGEEEILGILGALTSLGKSGAAAGEGVAPGPFQESMEKLPGQAQDFLKQALATLAAAAPEGKPDQAVLIRLAEHLAIRFALERYERGEVKVNAVRQLLDHMNHEIENLRNILGAHEDKMTEAGLLVESHLDILDRQFWAGVPETSKRSVLLSEESWCIPARNLRQFVNQLLEKGEVAEATTILRNYAACVEREEHDARRKAAIGLAELADLYAKVNPALLGEALRHLGVRVSLEQDNELRTLVSAAFVRFCQEAATTRCYAAMEQALDLIAGVETQRPGIARNLRPKMGIEARLPEFLDEALRAKKAAPGLTNVLRQLPQATMEQLSLRINRSQLRSDCAFMVELTKEVGGEALGHLRSTVRGGPVSEAADMVGLLSLLDAEAVEAHLPQRMKDFPRVAQDRIVRQIASARSPACCKLLLALVDYLDPLVMPLAIDEIGVTGRREALPRLLCIVDGDLPPGASPYLRVKAIEALGRIHAPESIKSLKRIAESKQMWRWSSPQELRIAALQSLEKLDPDWVREFRPRSGIESEDLALAPLDVPSDSRWVRQRRHRRVRFPKPIFAVSTNLRESCHFEIRIASLSGGIARTDRHLAPGTQVELRLQVGLRNLVATAMTRDYRAQDMAFEIVDIGLEERGRFRRLLAENMPHDKSSSESVESRAETLVTS